MSPIYPNWSILFKLVQPEISEMSPIYPNWSILLTGSTRNFRNVAYLPKLIYCFINWFNFRGLLNFKEIIIISWLITPLLLKIIQSENHHHLYNSSENDNPLIRMPALGGKDMDFVAIHLNHKGGYFDIAPTRIHPYLLI